MGVLVLKPFSGGAGAASEGPKDATTEPPSVEQTPASDSAPPIDRSASQQVAASVDVPGQAPDGVDAAGNPTSYASTNLLDADPETAWREPGDGSGQDLTIALDQTRTVTSLGLINGYAKTDASTRVDRYHQERRILQVTWTFDDMSVVQRLKNSRSMQTITLDHPVQAGSVTLHIDATTGPGDSNFDYTAISEILVKGQ